MWIDDIKDWTKLDSYEKIKRNAADRLKWRTYTTRYVIYMPNAECRMPLTMM